MAVVIIPEGCASVEYRTLDEFGFPGYAVGDDGSVWTRKKRGFGMGLLYAAWRPLLLSTNKRGYRGVALYYANSDGVRRRKRYSVHELVLTIFVCPRPEGKQVCHFDGNKNNNCVGNLRWGTPKENYLDSVRLGTVGCRARGEDHHQTRYSDEDVALIRSLVLEQHVPYREITERFGISPGHISRLVHYVQRI